MPMSVIVLILLLAMCIGASSIMPDDIMISKMPYTTEKPNKGNSNPIAKPSHRLF